MHHKQLTSPIVSYLRYFRHRLVRYNWYIYIYIYIYICIYLYMYQIQLAISGVPPEVMRVGMARNTEADSFHPSHCCGYVSVSH